MRPSEAKIKELDDADAARMDADAASEIVASVRHSACDLTGGNWAFALDDLNQIVALARRACEAGLTEGMAPEVRAKIARIHNVT